MCTIFYLYLCGVAYFTLMPVLSALPESGGIPTGRCIWSRLTTICSAIGMQSGSLC